MGHTLRTNFTTAALTILNVAAPSLKEEHALFDCPLYHDLRQQQPWAQQQPCNLQTFMALPPLQQASFLQGLLRSALRKGLDPCARAVTAAGSHMPARGSPAHDSCLSETGACISIAWTGCAAIMFACTACILRAKFAQSLMGLLGSKTDSKSNE